MLISNFIYKNRLQFAYTCYRRKITWWLFSLGLQSTLIFHYFSTPSIRHYLVHFIERGGYWGKKLSKIRDCLVFCFNSYHFCDIHPWEGRPWISSQIPPAIPSSLPPCKIGLNRQARPCLSIQANLTGWEGGRNGRRYLWTNSGSSFSWVYVTEMVRIETENKTVSDFRQFFSPVSSPLYKMD